MYLTKQFKKTGAASKWAKKRAQELFYQTGTMVNAFHCMKDGTAFKFYCDGLTVHTQLLRKWPVLPEDSGITLKHNLVVISY